MEARDSWEVPSLSTRIVTERLALRPPRTTDVPELRRALRANAEHLRPWSTAPTPGEDPSSLTSVSRAVLRYRREWKRGQSFVLLITPRHDAERIFGRIALSGILRGAFQNAYVGYWVDAGHQGQGLTTEALRAITTFAFQSAALHRVQAAIMPRNVGSRRVVEKAGYRHEGLAQRYLSIAGTWEDHMLFAATTEDWERKPDP